MHETSCYRMREMQAERIKGYCRAAPLPNRQYETKIQQLLYFFRRCLLRIHGDGHQYSFILCQDPITDNIDNVSKIYNDNGMMIFVSTTLNILHHYYNTFHRKLAKLSLKLIHSGIQLFHSVEFVVPQSFFCDWSGIVTFSFTLASNEPSLI